MKAIKFKFDEFELLNERLLKETTWNIKYTNVEAIEFKPSLRVIKCKDYFSHGGRRSVMKEYYLAFPYVQLYLYNWLFLGDEPDAATGYQYRISFSKQSVTVGGSICAAPLPNVTDCRIFRHHGLCVGKNNVETANDLGNSFWNTSFNRYFDPSLEISHCFAKWGSVQDCHNHTLLCWHNATAKYGLDVADADWPQSAYSFEELTTGRKK